MAGGLTGGIDAAADLLANSAMEYYEAYGALARTNPDPLVQAVRTPAQAVAEKGIVADIVQKLGLRPEQSLLEIGCGPGNLAIPLSFFVRDVTAIDHPSVIERCAARYSATGLNWVGGRFPDVDVGTFDRILVYAALHYLPDMQAAQDLVIAALNKLNSGGQMLLGDLPNTDKKSRFLSTEEGQAFDREYRSANAASESVSAFDKAMKVFEGANGIGAFSDATILGLIEIARSAGCDAYILPQPRDLPFGRTREDILISKP